MNSDETRRTSVSWRRRTLLRVRDWVTLFVAVALLVACGADDVGPLPSNEPVPPPPPGHIRGFDLPGALAAVDMWIHIDDIEIGSDAAACATA